MRAAFAIAALAGSAIAAPSYGTGYGHPNKPVENVVVVVETVTETCYVTEGYVVPSATSSSVYVAPAAPTTTVVQEPAKPTYGYGYPVPSMPAYEPPAPAPVKPTPTPEAPKPTVAPSPAPAPAPPANSGYMGIVDEWRTKMGFKDLAQSSKLEGTAMNTLQSAPGQMVHKLNPGVYGQVLAMGEANEFEHVYVGGWLCEVPNAKGLGDVCKTQSEGWNYEGQTGHAEILTSTQYKEIGCAQHQGVWCCDLA